MYTKNEQSSVIFENVNSKVPKNRKTQTVLGSDKGKKTRRHKYHFFLIIIIKYDTMKTKSQSEPKPHTEQILPVPL